MYIYHLIGQLFSTWKVRISHYHLFPFNKDLYLLIIPGTHIRVRQTPRSDNFPWQFIISLPPASFSPKYRRIVFYYYFFGLISSKYSIFPLNILNHNNWKYWFIILKIKSNLTYEIMKVKCHRTEYNVLYIQKTKHFTWYYIVTWSLLEA